MTTENTEQANEKGGQEHAYAPAYVAFNTLLSFIDSLDPRAKPRRIDRSMIHGQSGGTERKLMSALAFLGLTRTGGEATELLHELIDSKGNPEQRKSALASVLDAAYAKVVGHLDIATATDKELTDAFRKAGVDGTTLQEAIRFYIKARKAAGLPMSPYIKGRKPRGVAPRPADKNGARQHTKRTPVALPGEPEKKPNPPDAGGDLPPTRPGMIRFPIHTPGKPEGLIIVHEDLKLADCEMINAILTAYAKRRSESD